MKTELRPSPHRYMPDTIVLEVWYDGQFIGTVNGADGPGIRFISHRMLLPVWVAGNDEHYKICEIRAMP